MPFWLIPGDMLILGPVLALASPTMLSEVGVAAASGGLIPWQRSFSTGAGVFQVVAGREVRAVLFGFMGDLLGVVPGGPLPDGSNPYVVVKFKSVQLEFPVLEWTPFRTFATQLTFAAQLQLGFSVGLPVSTEVLYPVGTPFSTTPGWSILAARRLRRPLLLRLPGGSRGSAVVAARTSARDHPVGRMGRDAGARRPSSRFLARSSRWARRSPAPAAWASVLNQCRLTDPSTETPHRPWWHHTLTSCCPAPKTVTFAMPPSRWSTGI